VRQGPIHLTLWRSAFEVLGCEEDRQRLPDNLRLSVTQDTLSANVPTGDPSGEIDQENRIIPDRLDPDIV
jgi:hypothetical protein